MQVFKTISNTIGSVGNVVESTCATAEILVGDEGLKSTTRYTFAILNNSLRESSVISGLETDYNIEQFKIAHAKKVGRPPKKDKK